MAARRLVIVMLVLLGLSTLAAALVPGPDRSTSTGAGTGTGTVGSRPEGGSTADVASGPQARLVQQRLWVSAEPTPVWVRPGDQLRLAVSGPHGDQITIPAFGLTETMSPYAPALFDLLIPRSGRFPVLAERSGLVVGRIVSRRRPPPCPALRPPARRERSRPRACDRRGRGAASAGVRSDRKP